jgi:NAD(P)-dependent dehydrogenase (short-subunit alcohol dehydrogenase family)
MVDLKGKVALIVGAGSGLSASVARVFANAGMRIALAARSIDDLAGLAAETGAKTFACDASDVVAVKRLFADVAGAAALGDPHAVVYNASYRTRGPLVDLDPAEVARSLAVSAFGGFLVAQEAARRMLPRGAGAILFTARRPESADHPDAMLDPDAIAQSYLFLLTQPRSSWTWEIEVRPWVEKF